MRNAIYVYFSLYYDVIMHRVHQYLLIIISNGPPFSSLCQMTMATYLKRRKLKFTYFIYKNTLLGTSLVSCLGFNVELK